MYDGILEYLCLRMGYLEHAFVDVFQGALSTISAETTVFPSYDMLCKLGVFDGSLEDLH